MEDAEEVDCDVEPEGAKAVVPERSKEEVVVVVWFDVVLCRLAGGLSSASSLLGSMMWRGPNDS